MWEDPTTYPYLIPLIWQGDGPNPSPGYSSRGSMYGVSGIPHCQWGGNLNYVGGGTSTLPAYISRYNTLSAENSPAEMTLELNTNETGQLAFLLDVTLTANITTTNNKIVYVLTHNWEPGQSSYFASVVSYEQEVFNLTTAGETGSYEHVITMASNWDLTKLKAVAMIQTFDGTHKIHQAATAGFSGLLPMFTANITEGPAYLGVQFTSNSFPQNGIDSWEWDFDGDGIFDSTEENPYHLYLTPGDYDVTLRITVDGETAETTSADLIHVTDGSNVSGALSGMWVSDFNPYTITDDANIPAGNELIIQPGVEMYFESGVRLTVQGKLVADASSSPEEPIIFSSNSNWEGIRFMNTTEANLIQNCELSNANLTAISIETGSMVDVIGNKLFNNSSTSAGAAIDVSSCTDVLISRNIISNNTSSSSTPGIKCTGSPITISNNIIVNNTGTFSGMLMTSASNALIENNTIANNLSTNGTPYLFYFFNSFPTIINCVIVDEGTVFFAPFGNPSVTYSCITGGFSGEGNIDADPLFANPTTGNGAEYNGLDAYWWLQSTSPCIDAGNPDAAYNDPDGTRNDMGAFGGPNALEVTVGNDGNPVAVVTNSSIDIYPNPFNPSTSIALNLTENDKHHPVSVNIYNIKGQLVKTLIDNEVVNANTLVWNGTDNYGNRISSGMYFAKVNTQSSNLTRKMLLLK
ncbi:MAG TPA: right-handed parallel beta-helix repeat-containing protein [Candidatus Cloacimonadota bacterium]|nr:right-handed parallel beta-helix repeat-containing protein [Candidatus Cloacimonadota bacterium]